jgi:hypothetical protein
MWLDRTFGTVTWAGKLAEATAASKIINRSFIQCLTRKAESRKNITLQDFRSCFSEHHVIRACRWRVTHGDIGRGDATTFFFSRCQSKGPAFAGHWPLFVALKPARDISLHLELHQ